jgi:hypothetical protein
MASFKIAVAIPTYEREELLRRPIGTAPTLEIIWRWLETHGLQRESDDLHPLTDWNGDLPIFDSNASLFMAGRFGQWKYYWPDDCVLRGKRIAQIGSKPPLGGSLPFLVLDFIVNQLLTENF